MRHQKAETDQFTLFEEPYKTCIHSGDTLFGGIDPSRIRLDRYYVSRPAFSDTDTVISSFDIY